MNILKEHNIRVYDNLCSAFEGSTTVCLETATGTGKSYVTVQLLMDYSLRALIVSPRVFINNQWDTLMGYYNICGDTITYQSLALLNEDEIDVLVDNYDIVIFDECHHLKADKWFVNASTILDSGVKCLGLSADCIRWTDGGEDTRDLFGTVVHGYTLGEAIDAGVLSPFVYAYGVFDKDGLKRALDKVTTADKRERIDLCVDNIQSIRSVLSKYRKEYSIKKIIVFAESILDCSDALDAVEGLFGTVYQIHSGYTSIKNESEIKKFRKADDAAMVCVNMLNEGLHISGVDSVLMLRRTQSPNVFMQQIGRCLSVGSGVTPVVIDLTCNAVNIKGLCSKRGTSTLINMFTNLGAYSDKILITSELGSFEDVLNSISVLYSNVRWTEEEKQYLRNNVDVPLAVLAEELHRTVSAVNSERHKLGLSYIDREDWSDEDKARLIQVYASNKVRQLQKAVEAFPNRTYCAVRCMASRLGLKVTLYDEDEERFVLANYTTMSYSEIAKHCGDHMTVRIIRGILKRNGVAKKDIVSNYGVRTYSSTSTHDYSFEKYGDYLHLHKHEFIEQFKTNRNRWSAYSDMFQGISYKRMRAFAVELGLISYDRKNSPFTDEERAYLMECRDIDLFMDKYQTHPRNSVRMKMIDLGIWQS